MIDISPVLRADRIKVTEKSAMPVRPETCPKLVIMKPNEENLAPSGAMNSHIRAGRDTAAMMAILPIERLILSSFGIWGHYTIFGISIV